MTSFLESVVEEVALVWLEAIGWHIVRGESSPGFVDIGLDMPATERREYGQVILAQRLRDTFLKKFIAGELRAREAHKTVEEMT